MSFQASDILAKSLSYLLKQLFAILQIVPGKLLNHARITTHCTVHHPPPPPPRIETSVYDCQKQVAQRFCDK